MDMKVLGSSSSGNCYILDNGKEALIIEAGVNFAKIKRALDYNISRIAGCIVTHQHHDHAKHADVIARSGIDTLALPEVWESKGLYRHSVVIRGKGGYLFGNFKVLPFYVQHDVPCVGYMIEHPDTGRILFLTDSCNCNYTFTNLRHILIECNYSNKVLAESIRTGRTAPEQMQRLAKSHMELQDCINFLLNTDLSKVQNIILLHLSDKNSDEAAFVEAMEQVTGKAVYAAKPGMIVSLDRID